EENGSDKNKRRFAFQPVPQTASQAVSLWLHIRDTADLPVRMGFSTGDLEIWHKPTRSEDL
ncbi:MAG: hypothetical protein QOH35_3450, partial [Acidobacteriaceae bacterium]|nr:hypothetical protein [Acidobacteriaceae bacterium]